MNAQESINNWFASFEHRMHEHVPNLVAETAVEFSQSKFKTQEWDGVPWQPLSPSYAKRKSRGKGKILTSTANLMLSIRPSVVTANRIVVSAGNAKVPYARIHNEGGRVRGVRYVKPHHNNNFMGKGERKQIRGHSRKVDYKVPKRQFMGHSNQLNLLLKERLTNYFNAK